jgi:sialate O-acetylesterase
MKRFACLAATVALVSQVTPAPAAVKLPAILGDHMVLQSGAPVPIWGSADPGEAVSVSVNGVTKEATADDTGKWQVVLDPLEPGGPIEIQIAGTNTLTLRDVLVGEVWVCSGQSNMEWSVRNSNNAAEEIAAATDGQIRLFTVNKAVADEPLDDCIGQWVVCSPQTVQNFSAVGYFFGRQLRKDLQVPVGLINTSWGGTPVESWISRQSLAANETVSYMLQRWEEALQKYPQQKKDYETALAAWQKELDAAKAEEARLREAVERGADVDPATDAAAELEGKPADAADDANAPKRRTVAEIEKAKPQPPGDPSASPWAPASLYNGMIAPIVPCAVRGAIWYQGESNAGRAKEYQTLMPMLIEDWRRAWSDEKAAFAFYMVQLANFTAATPQPVESDWAELREAQFLTTQKLEHVGIATAIDIGEANDIHPRNKQEVGRRLALAAEAMTYGMKDVVPSGPVYDGMTVEGSSIRLKFKHIGGGLVQKGDRLAGFQIAGEDRKWVWADAKIDGESVVVSSPDIARPVAVRYAWANNPPSTLYNQAGLPALPFRTDDWPMITEGRKR